MIQMLSVIIVAAGKGSRMGCVKKQFLPFQGMPLFLHSVNAFIKAGAEEIWIAVPKEDLTLAKEWLIKYQMPEFCMPLFFPHYNFIFFKSRSVLVASSPRSQNSRSPITFT